jgi:hypothetical protein
MVLVVMLSHHLSVVVSTVSHDAIQRLSLAMPFGDCHSRCRSVDYLGRSEIIFGLIWNCFCIIALVRHRSNSLDHLIISPVLLQSH